MTSGPTLVLASASPRRRDLLRLAGLHPVVRPAEVDESAHDREAPADLVLRLAVEKAHGVPRRPDEVVLAADTTVALGDRVLGKPADAADAAAMLAALAGRWHHVTTAVAVIGGRERARTAVVTTGVLFTRLDDSQIARYVATGEPLDKAGAYGVQGRAAAFVERIEGSYTGVVGLPLAQTLALLREEGITPESSAAPN